MYDSLLHELSNGGWNILSEDCAKATISVNSIKRGQENDATDRNYDLLPSLQGGSYPTTTPS